MTVSTPQSYTPYRQLHDAASTSSPGRCDPPQELGQLHSTCGVSATSLSSHSNLPYADHTLRLWQTLHPTHLREGCEAGLRLPCAALPQALATPPPPWP
ncbi:hypothetical protein HaLaN_31274 [Haematococcus lacustris]|uniref:Uncharacterized protein n=1 Tax=Haematococcus lacustris TaxID=44745 RepID=A0A6A0AGM6_HAELA|nr:hypothetical protein HaLaN_31274 [Haematococcus lacustris]